MSADYAFSPLQGASVTLAASTTGSNVTAINPNSVAARCSNRSATEWMRVYFSPDPAVIGAAGGPPAMSLTAFGMSIPPGGVIIYLYAANPNQYATAWVESGSTANCVIEPGNL